MSETSEKYARTRDNYRLLDDADKILFWIHFALAPFAMVASTVLAFGWPAVTFWIGAFLWKGSDMALNRVEK
jgi:uncharacterized membrane protein